MRAAVVDTPLSLGVTPLVGSIHRLLSVAHLQRSDGTIVEPSHESVAACAADTAATVDGTFDGRHDLAASTNTSCYPLSEAVAAVVRTSYGTAECAGDEPTPLALAKLLRWLLEGEQQARHTLGPPTAPATPSCASRHHAPSAQLSIAFTLMPSTRPSSPPPHHPKVLAKSTY